MLDVSWPTSGNISFGTLMVTKEGVELEKGRPMVI
jgi:hypothetical protein